MLDTIREIILKKLDGSANEEELRQLQAWRAEGEANLLEIKKMEKLISATTDLSDYKEFDPDNAWNHIEQKTANKGNIRILLLVILLLFLTAAAYFSYKYVYPKEEIQIYPIQYATDRAVEEIILEDNSAITLAPETKLEIMAFRTMKLTGKAYFNVSKDPENPFVVLFGDQKIEVLGTSFLVDYTAENTELIVTSGKVRFYWNDQHVDVSSDNSLHFFDNNVVISKHNNPNKFSWQNNTLVFTSTPLQKVIADLERYYDVQIIVDESVQKQLNECYLTSKYKNENLSTVLDDLSKLFSMEYNAQSNKIVITAIKCK